MGKVKRHDWEKLQREFNLYKSKDNGRTLKDFCKLKGLSYNHATIKLKVYKSKEKAKEYNAFKTHIFDTTLKNHAENTAIKEALEYIDKMKALDELFTLSIQSILNKFSEQKDYKTLYEGIKSLSLIVKAGVDLDKIKLDYEIQNHSSGKEFVAEEESFFNNVLNVQIETPNLNNNPENNLIENSQPFKEDIDEIITEAAPLPV